MAVAAAAGLLTLLSGSISAQRSAVPAKADARTIVHVLNRIGFGPRPGDIARVQQMGLAAYIDQQLNPERIQNEALELRLSEFTTLDLSTRELADQFFLPADMARREQQQRQAQQAQAQTPKTAQTGQTGQTMTAMTPPPPPQPNPQLQAVIRNQQNVVQELMQAKVLRAVMSERQLEEVLADFWFNHFNVFIQKGQVRQYVTAYERDAIRPHVFGKFRDMLGATAHSPAMLFYLDNFQSQAPPGAPVLGGPNDLRFGRGRGGDPFGRRPVLTPNRPANPNPPPQPQRPQRGLNENYARELMELHTLGVDGGYTQQDVIEVARILTGWTIDRPQVGGSFIFRPQAHDAGEKIVLGTKFPAGKGEEEGEKLLDLLAAHPSTAKHIAFKLVQRFVADEPPPALVARVAKTFTDTKGDLRAVTRAVITSPEFFADDAYRAKVKTPFEFVVSAARATNATITNAQPIVGALAQQLGMPLYGCQPPTGYSMTADAWVNTGSLLNRMNFAMQLVTGGQPPRPNGRGIGDAPRPNAPPRPNQPDPQTRALLAGRGQMARGPIQVDVRALVPEMTDAVRAQLGQSILAGDFSPATEQTLARATTPHQLLALTLGSPEFQRR
jgi:uncharacterized protein (DUF1800 family)